MVKLNWGSGSFDIVCLFGKVWICGWVRLGNVLIDDEFWFFLFEVREIWYGNWDVGELFCVRSWNFYGKLF